MLPAPLCTCRLLYSPADIRFNYRSPGMKSGALPPRHRYGGHQSRVQSNNVTISAARAATHSRRRRRRLSQRFVFKNSTFYLNKPATFHSDSLTPAPTDYVASARALIDAGELLCHRPLATKSLTIHFHCILPSDKAQLLSPSICSCSFYRRPFLLLLLFRWWRLCRHPIRISSG